MRAIMMFFPVIQAPKCKLHTFATTYWQSFHDLSKPYRRISGFKLVGASTYDVQGEHRERWVRKPLSTKTEGRCNTQQNNKPPSISHELSDSNVLTSFGKNLPKVGTVESQRTQYFDIRQQTNKDVANLLTTIVFDLETTGRSKQHHRIIEVAFQDLSGGDGSSFQTLVNPNCSVSNSFIHNISTEMVSKPGVPRMEELVPILLQYVKSRQKPGGCVMLVAHNARSFDVPFLVSEFSRCSVEIPSDWFFMDTLPLARELKKSEGHSSKTSSSLQALREHYDIELDGQVAHRAMADVNILALVLQRMTFDMKLPVSGLLERCFTAAELIDAKKKKKSTSW